VAAGLIRYIRKQGLNGGPFARGTKRLKNPYPRWLATVMLVGFWAVLLAAVSLLEIWPPFLLFWLLPMITSFSFFMRLREIAHHSNAPDDGDLTNSRVFRCHPVVEACVFPYGQAYHLTHHLFGMLPHYRAAKAHDVLMRYPPYRTHAVVCRGYFVRTPGTNGPTVLDVLAAVHPGRGPNGERLGDTARAVMHPVEEAA